MARRRKPRREPKPCIVDGCPRRAQVRQCCPMHDRRILLYADPHQARPERPDCAIDQCERKAQVHHVCAMHYSRILKHGSPDLPFRRRKTCIIDGCSQPAKIRNCCPKHDHRILYFGDPFRTRPAGPRRPRDGGTVCRPKVCVEFNCGQPTFANRRCQAHFVAAYLDAIPAGCYG